VERLSFYHAEEARICRFPFHLLIEFSAHQHLLRCLSTLLPSLNRINLAMSKLALGASTRVTRVAGVTRVTTVIRTAAGVATLLASLGGINLAVCEFAGTNAAVRLAILAETVVFSWLVVGHIDVVFVLV